MFIRIQLTFTLAVPFSKKEKTKRKKVPPHLCFYVYNLLTNWARKSLLLRYWNRSIEHGPNAKKNSCISICVCSSDGPDGTAPGFSKASAYLGGFWRHQVGFQKKRGVALSKPRGFSRDLGEPQRQLEGPQIQLDEPLRQLERPQQKLGGLKQKKNSLHVMVSQVVL